MEIIEGTQSTRRSEITRSTATSNGSNLNRFLYCYHYFNLISKYNSSMAKYEQIKTIKNGEE